MRLLNTFLKSIVIIFFLLHFCACTETESPPFEATARNLESKIVMDRDSGMIIGKTNIMTMFGNSLYIQDKYEEYHCTEYNTETREYSRFCRHGQGPGEMLMPAIAMSTMMVNDTAYLLLYDINIHRICLFDMCHKKTYKKIMPFGSNNSNDFTRGVYIVNDSIMLSVGCYEGYACKLYKNRQPMEKYMKAFTKKGEDIDYRKVSRDGNKFDVSPNKSHIVRITQIGGLIEAYKIVDDELQQSFRREYFDVICTSELKTTNDSRYGYIDVTISNNKIYALYSGGIVHARDENGIQTSYKSKTVHVYDMEGKELETLLLDKFVTALAVKADDTELYALSDAEKDLLLYKLN
jgi:hypothetical protein